MIEAKVIADSVSYEGKRITTLQVKFHRFILPEFNTHRVFSRNFSSSRAIPTSKLIEQVYNDPAMPIHWGKNQPGMQAGYELEGEELTNAQREWRVAAHRAAESAKSMSDAGAHKQIVNRIIEPYLWVHGIVTSTEWANFFELRAHPDAQPEIQELAIKMRDAIDNSIPVILDKGDWHLPYVSYEDSGDIEELKKISAARCCRVSYLKHDGTNPSREEDLALFDRLAGSIPLHASPLEHQATPDTMLYTDGGYTKVGYANTNLHGNLNGWIQHRKLWEKQIYAGANHL